MQDESTLQRYLTDAIEHNDIGAFLQLSKAMPEYPPRSALGDGCTWLMLCAKHNRAYFVKRFASQATYKNVAGETALMMAAMHGSLQVARLLRESEMNLIDENGWTALMHAAAQCDVYMVKLLYNEQGMQSKRPVGEFPASSCALFIAAMYGSFPLVQMLAKEINLLDSPQIEVILQHTSNHKIDYFLRQAKTRETAECSQGVFVFERNGHKFSSLADELQSTLLPASPAYMRAQDGDRQTERAFSDYRRESTLLSENHSFAAHAISDRKMLTLTLEIDGQDYDSAEEAIYEGVGSETSQRPQGSAVRGQSPESSESALARQAYTQHSAGIEREATQKDDYANSIAMRKNIVPYRPCSQAHPCFPRKSAQESRLQEVSSLRYARYQLQQHDKGTQTSAGEGKSRIRGPALAVLAVSLCVLGCALLLLFYTANRREI